VLALYIVAGILLSIILVLSVPVDLVFDFTSGGDGKKIVRVEWFFGLVGRNLLPRKKPGKRGKRKKRDFRYFLSYMALARTRGMVPAFVRLGRRMIGSFHIRQLSAELRLGLDDPADTGTVYGILWPAFVLPIKYTSATLAMDPVFDGSVFEAAFQGEVRIFPVEIAANVLRFVFSPSGLRLIKAMAVLQWKKRK
jgi:hypothetical protein